MRIDDTERINACELEVELRTGKPRQRKEWSGEAQLGTFKAATRLQHQLYDEVGRRSVWHV